MKGDLLALWLAALPLMGSPGPATMSLAAIGAAMGAAAGRHYLAGIIVGTIAVLLWIATGITAILLTVPALEWLVAGLAATYIVYLAYRIATAPVLLPGDKAVGAPSFWGGGALAIANPKAYAAIGAVYSGNSLGADTVFLEAAYKIAALFPVIVIVNAAWLVFGSTFSALLRNPRSARAANVIFAGLLLLSVAWSMASP